LRIIVGRVERQRNPTERRSRLGGMAGRRSGGAAAKLNKPR